MTNYKVLIDNVLDVIDDIYKNRGKEFIELTDISILLDDIEICSNGKIYCPIFHVIYRLETEFDEYETGWIHVCSTDPKEKIKNEIEQELKKGQKRLNERVAYEELSHD